MTLRLYTIATMTTIALLSLASIAQATPSSTCFSGTRTLSRGMNGQDVTSLQQFLVAQSFLSSDSATGYFGDLTQAAVQKWQASHGIVSTGTAATTGFGAVGPKTRAAMQSSCGSASPTASPTASSTTSPTTSSTSSIQNGSATCSVTASKQSVKLNEAFTVSWQSTNADYITDPSGARASANGSTTVRVIITGPYMYSITAHGGENATCTTTVTVEQ